MSDEPPFLDRRREAGPAPRIPSALERHIQTIMVAVVCALLAWMGNKITSTSETLAALRAENNVHIANLHNEIRNLQSALEKSYSLSDATRDLQYRDAAIEALSSRIRYLERRLEALSAPPWTIFEDDGSRSRK